jgi:molecular chaperone GrpE
MTTGHNDEVTDDGASEVSEDLDALLEDTKRERDEYLALAQRAKADFENYRKRAQRDAAEAERRGRGKLAGALLPSVDNLERAMLAAGIDPRRDQAASEEVTGQEALARGVELVHAELQNSLARAGVEPFDPIGERFNPATCEAISTRPADGEAAGTVVETLERGYRLDGDVVLRPARVIVSE